MLRIGIAMTIDICEILTSTNPDMPIPTGVILPFASSSVPPTFAACDGSELVKADYAALYAVIGDAFANTDTPPAPDNFNLPDLRCRIPVGCDLSNVTGRLGGSNLNPVTVGNTGGEGGHVLLTNEMPSHTHSDNESPSSPSVGNLTTDIAVAAPLDGSGTTGSTGGDEAHNNVQPSIVINYIIKT